jgi:hypothetical protein
VRKELSSLCKQRSEKILLLAKLGAEHPSLILMNGVRTSLLKEIQVLSDRILSLQLFIAEVSQKKGILK